MKHTPLYEEHLALGGQMENYFGFALPSEYLGKAEEHMAVRQKAGLSDRSYLARILVAGPNAAVFVQRITTNDVSDMQLGDCEYSLICNEKGGVMDDVILYKWDEKTMGITVHPENKAKILAHMQRHSLPGAKLLDVSESTAQITLQGPRSKYLLSTICEHMPTRRNQCSRTKVAGRTCFIASVGYSGESSYVLFCKSEHAAELWRVLLDAGEEDEPIPCGTEAWHSLRLEAGVATYGYELSESVTPFEVGLGQYVRPLQADFIGKQALEAQVFAGVPRKRIGLLVEGEDLIEQGDVLYDDDVPCGKITSSGWSYCLDTQIAMALVNSSFLEEKQHQYNVKTKQGRIACQKAALPFYKAIDRY